METVRNINISCCLTSNEDGRESQVTCDHLFAQPRNRFMVSPLLLMMGHSSFESERLCVLRVKFKRRGIALHSNYIRSGVYSCNTLPILFTLALNPRWDAAMNFTIDVPELALIRFSVRDQIGLLKSEFAGQYTLPFTSMKKG